MSNLPADRPTPRLAAASHHGEALVVEFIAAGDRIAHRVSLAAADGSITPLVESLEGAPDDPWPPSPALQSLNHDQLVRVAADGVACPAVLVGMSGNSHWSLGVETAVVDGQTALAFDAAVRVKTPPAAPIGSRYRMLVATEAAAPGVLRLATPAGAVHLTTLPLIADEPASGPAVQHAADACCIACPVAADINVPTTLRWRYQLALLAR
ncbi:MAG: hypothetical protein KDA44_16305 [Planctomycetales bacterium]|nr:hypothetical protein [Planctomycetales bacterium]